MYCPKCGQVVTGKYCGHCGWDLSQVPRSVAPRQAKGSADCSPASRSVEKKVPPVGQGESFRAVAVLCALLICCFLLPFVSVSCGGVKVSASGMELALGQNIEGEKVDMVVSALAALLLAVASLICSYTAIHDAKVGAAVVPCAGACLLALFVIPSELKKQAGGGLDLPINYELGYWLAIILCLTAVVVGGVELAKSSKPPGQQRE